MTYLDVESEGMSLNVCLVRRQLQLFSGGDTVTVEHLRITRTRNAALHYIVVLSGVQCRERFPEILMASPSRKATPVLPGRWRCRNQSRVYARAEI